MADKIMNYFGNGEKLGVKIEYYVEETPLGNAGALYKLRDRIGAEPFLLLNADTVFDVDVFCQPKIPEKSFKNPFFQHGIFPLLSETLLSSR